MAQQELPTSDEFFGKAQLPTADEFFAPPEHSPLVTDVMAGASYLMGHGEVPASSGSMDNYIKHSSTGRILDAIGHGASQAWGTEPLVPDEFNDTLKKAGVFNDYTKGQNSLIKSFNEAILRPAAAGIAAAWRGQQAAFGAVQAGVAQVGQELEGGPVDVAAKAASYAAGKALNFSFPTLGVEPEAHGIGELAREAAALPEAFPLFGAELGRNVPHAYPTPKDFVEAQDLNVIGAGEAGWKGTAAPVTGKLVEPFKNITINPVSEAERAAEPTPDIHALARQIDPETLTQFDTLAQRKETFRRWIGELDETRRQQAEAEAPHGDEIAELQDKIPDATPRLAKKYQARIETMQEERDKFIEDRTTGDSADMAKIRQKLMETDYAMRDLSPKVGQAYRAAQEQVPRAEGVAEEVAPTTAPETSEVTPPTAEAKAEPTPLEKQAAAEPELPAPPPEAVAKPSVTTPEQVRSISADVAKKLVAAGRPAEEADAAGKLIASHYWARAARFNGAKGTGLDLYNAEGPAIRAGRERGKVGDREFAQSEPAPNFYSAVAQTIENAKQEKASADQWRGMLKNAPGVKPEELEWLGLDDWLKQQKGAVTKQQIGDYVRANQIEVMDAKKGNISNEWTQDAHGNWMANGYWIKPENGKFTIYSNTNRTISILPTLEAAKETVDRHYAPEGATKFGSYTLPGGENYREMLLTLPVKSSEPLKPNEAMRDVNGRMMVVTRTEDPRFPDGNYTYRDAKTDAFRSSHWDEPNVLAHVRFDDRMVDGKKTLHVAEIQSDWHQKGRKQGYATDAVRWQVTPTQDGRWALTLPDRPNTTMGVYADREMAEHRRKQLVRDTSVPDAPFKTTWPELALKRMIRYAAENGYDRLSWDTGDTNAQRYDLSKKISSVSYKDGKLVAYSKDDPGRDVINDKVPPEKLADYVGKDVAEKLVAAPQDAAGFKTLSGLELRVGGEGMKAFYDKMLPAAANKLVKKFGAKVGESKLSDVDIKPDKQTDELYRELSGEEPPKTASGATVHSLDITTDLRDAAVEKGFPLFQGAKGKLKVAADAKNTITLFKSADASTFIHETGHQWLEELLQDAADKEAPADIVADAQTVRNWLGAKDGEPISRKQHETFARGFETYMMEGRAPSSKLAKVFEQFRQWLTSIYQTVAKLRSPINDDIRDVFYRLIVNKPERTVIAPEREAAKNFADLHEADAESATPEEARPAADVVQSERDRIAAETAPEHQDERLENVASGAGRREAGGAELNRNANEAGALGGQVGVPAEHGEIGAGRGEVASEGATAREEPRGLSRTKGPGAKGPRQQTLLEFLAAHGGIRNDDPLIADLRASIGKDNKFIPGFGQLIRNPAELSEAAKRGGAHRPMSLDEAREAAVEAGYLHDEGRISGGESTSTINDLLGKADEELRGNKVYRIGEDQNTKHDADYEAKKIKHLEGELDNALDEAGIPLTDLNGKMRARVLEIMDKEGVTDPIAAYERAAMEEVNDGAEHGRNEPVGLGEPIPGWDVPDDTAAAPSAGGEPTEVGERGASEAPRQPSAGNRATSEIPTGTNERFAEPASDLIDKAGNIRLDKLNQPDDIDQVIKDAAARNDDFLPERRNIITDGEALDLAEALGKDPSFLDLKKIGSAFNEEEIIAAKKLLIQSATAVRDAMRAAKDGAKESVISLAQAIMRHEMIQGKVAQATAEWGRAGRAFRMVMDGAKEAADLNAFLKQNTGRDLFQLQEMAKYGSSLDTPAQMSRFIAETAGGKLKRAVVFYYVNALISGPITHMRYSVGNAINALWTPIVEIPFAAASGSVRAALGKDVPDRVYLGEAGAQLYGLIKGSQDGIRAAYEAFRSGQSPALPGERISQQFLDHNMTNPIPGPIGTVIGVPGKSVAAIHSFFKSLRYEQNIQGLAYRQAMKEGLAGEDFNARIAELTRSPTPEMMEMEDETKSVRDAMQQSATKDALKELFMSPTQYHSAMGALTRFTNTSLLAKIVVPFMKIGSQITRNAFIERTPLGLLDKEVRGNLLGKNGGSAFDQQAGKMAAGMGLMAATVGMAAEGLATGDGPEDPKQRAIWMLNHRPNSITIGDLTLPYQGLGHLGMLMRFSANMYETAHAWDGEDGSKLATSFFQGLTKSVLDENFMRGAKDMLDAAYHWEEYGPNYIKNFVTNWLPFSVGLGQVARKVDDYQREIRGVNVVDGIFKSAKSKIPWVSQSLYPKRDRFGEPIPTSGPLPNYAEDPVVQEMERLKIGIGLVPHKIRGVQLTDQQYDDFSRIAGRLTKMRLDAMVNTIKSATIPDAQKIERINKIISDSREAARNKIMMQPGATIVQQAIQAKRIKRFGPPVQ